MWSVSGLPGTAQRLRGGAKRAAQRERGQPGGAEQVVQRLRAPAGPPEPEAEDQARDEAERREQRLETGEAHGSSSALFTSAFNFLERFSYTLPRLLLPPGCVCRRCQSYSPW